MGIEGRERYINPYTDFGFKKLFGTELNKDLQKVVPKKKKENARKMKAKGLSAEDIAEITGLTIEEIEQL